MANFDFLRRDDGYYELFADACVEAEKVYASSPAMCAVGCRKALELAVRWVYAADNTINESYRDNLASLIHESSFRDCLDQRVWQGIRAIWKIGNDAVHTNHELQRTDAVVLLRTLFAFVEWIDFCYGPDYVERRFDEGALPAGGIALTRGQVKAIRAREALLEESAGRIKELEAQLRTMSDELTKARESNEQTRSYTAAEDLSEWETRKVFIDADLRLAGWDFGQHVVEEREVHGMPVEPGNATGTGYVDYLLLGKDGRPLAVLEAKRTSKSAKKGEQQARLYAQCLEAEYGYSPAIFLSNGFETYYCADAKAQTRRVSMVFSQAELTTILGRRGRQPALSNVEVDRGIAGGGTNRYYQVEAIRAVCNNIEEGRRRSLLVMATGTGKTRVAAALVDVLMRGNRVKNALFLADRVALVRQAKHAFQTHLPDATLCDLCGNKDDRDARIVFSTYPTMMGAIDSARNDDGELLFTPAHFDLIVVDEAHRSIFKKYQAIFEYFDALVVGLTATPANEVDRNTYDFFEVERGVPTYAYEYDTAVNTDHVLVPYLGIQTHTKFLDEGITYDELSREDQERLEEDYHEVGEEVPELIPEGDLNRFLFNQGTVDEVLQTLMDKGIHVDGGHTLGKTIIFAANKRHAKYIVERFGALYPQLDGTYIQRVLHDEDYSQTIIDDFQNKARPVICVSVDMMDTGVDVPEVVNLVFFKKVRSKIKFWQMIGRGTRLAPELDVVDPLDDTRPGGAHTGKERFFIFDWCRNFEYFSQGGGEVEGRVGASLSEAVFARQSRIVVEYQSAPYAGQEWQDWRGELVDALHGQVSELADVYGELMTTRLHREAVEKFRRIEAFAYVDQTGLGMLTSELAPIVRSDESDVDALRLDALMYGYMCSLFQSGKAPLYRSRLLGIARNLQEKITIPQVRAKLPELQRICSEGYLDDVSPLELERLRRELRGLMRFVDRRMRPVVFTDLDDPVSGIEYSSGGPAPEDFADYRQKVTRYLTDHADSLVIAKLRRNQPLTDVEYRELERIFTQELGTAEDYSRAYEDTPFGIQVRKIVKLDHEAIMEAFAELLADHGLTDQQMSFLHLVIDHIERNGYLETGALARAPFDRPQPFVRLFSRPQQQRLVDAIRTIQDNALRPAA